MGSWCFNLCVVSTYVQSLSGMDITPQNTMSVLFKLYIFSVILLLRGCCEFKWLIIERDVYEVVTTTIANLLCSLHCKIDSFFNTIKFTRQAENSLGDTNCILFVDDIIKHFMFVSDLLVVMQIFSYSVMFCNSSRFIILGFWSNHGGEQWMILTSYH